MIHDLLSPHQFKYFEYHCNESFSSPDVQIWLRSHRIVEVLDSDLDTYHEDTTIEERGEEGIPITYTVRFADGFECGAFEDELLDSKEEYSQKDPPSFEEYRKWKEHQKLN